MTKHNHVERTIVTGVKGPMLPRLEVVNLQIHSDEASLEFHDSIHAPFSVVHLKQRLCRCSGNGGPQTCLPAACSVAPPVAQYGPSSSTNTQDPREGPRLALWTTQNLLRSGLTKQTREEVERSRQGVPREVLVTQAMTTKTRRVPGGRQPA